MGNEISKSQMATMPIGLALEGVSKKGSGNWKNLLTHLGRKGIIPQENIAGLKRQMDALTDRGLLRVRGFEPKKQIVRQALGQFNPMPIVPANVLPNNALVQRIQALQNPDELKTIVDELTRAYHQAQAQAQAQAPNRFDPILAGQIIDYIFGKGKPRGSSRNSGFIQRMLAENNAYHEGDYKRPFKNSKDSTMNKNVVFNYDKLKTPSDWIVKTFGKKSKKRDKPVSAGKTLETAIRELKARNPSMSQRALAKELGTSAATVNRVLKG